MATPTSFNSAFNVNDTIYICKEDGSAGSCQITAVGFREGFNPLAFDADTDFIYTTNSTALDGVSMIDRAQGFCFATKNDLSVYILALP